MILLLVSLLLAAPLTIVAQPNSLLPVPRNMRMGEGATPLTLDSGTTVRVTRFRDARLDRAVARFVDRAEARIGVPFAVPGGPTATIVIEVTAAGQRVQGIDENESYSLHVNNERAFLKAPTVVGAIRGLETLLQLITGDEQRFYVPEVAIEDEPRFHWRGLLVDVGRHFMPVEQIKNTLDGMALVKLNVLHWHLSEDQGFRVESKRFPKLHQLGSDGSYYTQSELRDVVAYARDRGIRVVPEFDMPGHSTAWFVGYPQYASRPAPIAIRREWGGADAIFDPSREETYTFIDQFIGEMVAIFPDQYWHIGGDEVEAKHWNGNARITRWRRARGFANTAAVQAHFNRRLTTILRKHGRVMIGWDEVLHPQLPTQTVVQSWRGVNYLSEAVRKGHPGILSAPYYLDHIKPATDFYLADPLPAGTTLTAEQQALVLGGEACMWSEFVSEETTDSRLWPRLGAVAERLWSPQHVTDVPDMYRRLDVLAGRLEGMGLRVQSHTARMLRQLMPTGDIAPLETLLTVAQPPFFGQRLNGVSTNQLQPLTRIVDAARPDPSARWLVERLVRRVVQGPVDVAARDSLATLFARWRDNAPRVRALGTGTPLIAQSTPASDALARTSEIGLQAIGYLSRGERPPSEWLQMSMIELKGYEGPQGLLRVSIVSEIVKLLVILGGVVS